MSKIWTMLAATVSVARAIQAPMPVSLPGFNLDSLGRVGLAGDFSGISLYEFSNQIQSSLFSNGSQSLLTQLPNGLFTSLGLADSRINAMCINEAGSIVIGGDFTSLAGVQAKGIALYDPENNNVTVMNGFDGKINALLCDKDTIYVGGLFSMDKSQNAMAWKDGQWQNLPFQGFTGPVRTITKSNNDTILFGGNFDGLRNFSTPAPSVKDAQTLNIVSAEISAEQTTDLAGFSDPEAITCTNDTGTQWLLQDGQKGAWTANFRYEFWPTKLRLINANHEGRGTKIFRFTAFPLGGIMNLTYVDPETKENKLCDAWCTLAQSDEPQDFVFVNNIGMKGFRLEIYEWYGAGGGLSSVQLFQDNIITYAIPSLNEPSCAVNLTRSGSSVNGTWSEQAIDPQGDSDYLIADINKENSGSSQIVFEPHIEQSGRYQVLLYTPGCLQDGSCSSRGSISVSVTHSKDGKPSLYGPIFQTNDYDKYDTVYDGPVDLADGEFRPSVTLSPAPDQSADVVRIVAQKVQLRLVGEAKNKTDSSDRPGSTAASSELNGIYEYDPREEETTDPASSHINIAGLSLNENASIASIVVSGDFTYVGGNFTDRNNDFQYFMVIDKNKPDQPQVVEGGLSDTVNVMQVVGDLIYIGGTFTGTKSGVIPGLSSIAAYDTAKQSWTSLRAGVNGVVTNIVSVSLNLSTGKEDCIAVSGEFSKIQPIDPDANTIDADGFAVWVPSRKQWLEALDSEELLLSGLLSAAVRSGDSIIYAGSVASNTMSASGTVFLVQGDKFTVEPSPLKFSDSQAIPTRKRQVVPENAGGVATGLFHVEDNKNLTILGGRFSAQGKSGVIRNLAFIDGNSDNGDITGASNEFSTDSIVMALQVLDNLLFVGGSLSGNNGISGIAIWDLGKMKLADDQPQPLVGDNVTVHAITNRPDSKDIYVAGEFDSAGSLTCANLCIYQNDRQQWVDATPETPGKINLMRWVGQDHLIIGGDMHLNDTATYLAMFDAKRSKFVAFDADVGKIPGPVTSIALDSASSDSMFVSGVSIGGSPFLMKLQGKKFVSLENRFDEGSEILNIQVLQLKDGNKHKDSGLLHEDHMLMVTGSLNLQGYGNTSAVTYDGSTWKPLILTSKANGEPGTIASFFSQMEQKFSADKARLARGYVILISLVIALALVFLIVVCGVLASYIRRRREGYQPAPSMATAEKSTHMQGRLPPQDLLHDFGTGRSQRPPMI